MSITNHNTSKLHLLLHDTIWQLDVRCWGTGPCIREEVTKESMVSIIADSRPSQWSLPDLNAASPALELLVAVPDAMPDTICSGPCSNNSDWIPHSVWVTQTDRLFSHSVRLTNIIMQLIIIMIVNSPQQHIAHLCPGAPLGWWLSDHSTFTWINLLGSAISSTTTLHSLTDARKISWTPVIFSLDLTWLINSDQEYPSGTGTATFLLSKATSSSNCFCMFWGHFSYLFGFASLT